MKKGNKSKEKSHPIGCKSFVMLPLAVPEMRYSRYRSAHFDRGADLFARCIRHRRRSQTVTTDFATLSR